MLDPLGFSGVAAGAEAGEGNLISVGLSTSSVFITESELLSAGAVAALE